MKKTTIILYLLLTLSSPKVFAQVIAGGNNEFESDFSGWTIMRDWSDPATNIVINTTSPFLNSKDAKCNGHATLYNQLYADITGLTVSSNYNLYFYAKGEDADFYVGPTANVYTGTYKYVNPGATYALQTVNFTATATTMRLWFDFYPNKVITVDAFSFGTPLPIELLSFNTTETSNHSVKIEWQTASEINNDYFTIERSKNGFEWEEIKRINGAGNSSSLLNYTTIDVSPYLGTSYYRLKQTDFDGRFSYSKIVAVNIESFNTVLIYPNPTNDIITITGAEANLEEIRILNSSNQDVTQLAKFKEQGKQRLFIDLSNLSEGLYFIKTKTTANKVYKQ